MAQLGDLPPELILAIFSHLRLGLPMHDLFVWTGDIDEHGRITGVKWNDLLNFSLLHRHFRKIVSDKLYTQIRIQGKLPITRLVSLLRFVTAHPDAAADVRQVYINLDPGRTGATSLRKSDVDFIEAAAAKAGISYPQKIFHCEDPVIAAALDEKGIYYKRPGFLELDALRLQVLVNISLANLKGTQELAITCDRGVFRNFDLIEDMPKSVYTIEDQVHVNGGGKGRPMVIGKPCLPQLFSLVTRDTRTELFRFYEESVGDEVANLLRMGPKTSRLCLDDTGVHFRLQNGGNWANISHLTLTSQQIGIAAMRGISERCGALSTFKYLPTAGIYERTTPAQPREVIHALRKHANTLRTLCISSSWHSPLDISISEPVSKVDGFVALENLWIDKRTMIGDLGVAQRMLDGIGMVDSREAFLRSLPRSLKRLHLHNAPYVPSAGLYWLAGNSELFPDLVRVELDWPMGGDDTPEEDMRKLFLQLGMHAPTRRDMVRDPQLWGRYF
ncbi:unnamed protein product [Colletotrichum noveboracense]|uniref:Uncharacterized protein n=1 Tax=Colletotrichum noveboracense TaxID=2664923 RepID=A0A9W4WDX4_9PEZI|nr:unnamed protein product [Colletotrichum noveboracense]